MEITIKWNVDSKSDEEPKKVSVNKLYGEMVMDKVRDNFWSYNEIGKKDDEIRDLKLENDRLMQQNKLMIDYIHALACIESKKSKFYALCESGKCPYYDHDKGFGKGACKLGSKDKIEQEAADLIDKLEEL